jgi:hypothetical protein
MIPMTEFEIHYRALMQLLVGLEQKHSPDMIERYMVAARGTAVPVPRETSSHRNIVRR